jgi:ATP-dependent DNA ligase
MRFASLCPSAIQCPGCWRQGWRNPTVNPSKRLDTFLPTPCHHVLRYSDEVSDAAKLLAVADKARLEGVVSKLSNQPYRPGKNLGWIKVKCAAWREANRDRGELFQH